MQNYATNQIKHSLYLPSGYKGNPYQRYHSIYSEDTEYVIAKTQVQGILPYYFKNHLSLGKNNQVENN
jgi:hypothetical protein